MQIKVCGIPYNVEIVPTSLQVSHSESGSHLYGEVSHAKANIRVDGSKTLEQINQALWHEIIHVITEILSIRELQTDDRNHLEIPIDQIALGVFMVLESLNIRLIGESK